MDFKAPEPQIQIATHYQYKAKPLAPSLVKPSPFDQFHAWFKEAQAPEDGSAPVREPEAMSLATATAQGVPSVRIVLLRQLDEQGFVFFTNYNSRKSQELKENPNAALSFHWKEVSRQIRVVGKVEKVSDEESAAYFKCRPIGSQIGAWASHQSSVISEDELPKKIEELSQKFGAVEGATNVVVPRPEFWGGWRVIPDEVEFWGGQTNRLHDRVRYLRQAGEHAWKIERLSP